MSISIWQADDKQASREVDVLVIGAGLVGCSAAYFAKQAGHDVVITEMRDIAMGASGRNAGFMISGLDSYYHHAVEEYGADVAREMWSLSHDTIDFWKKIVAESGDVPIQETGSLLLAETEKEAEELVIASKALKDAGIDVIFHDSDPLKRGYFAAIEQPRDAAVQPYKLTHAIFKSSDSELITNNEVYKIQQTAPDVVTVYTQQVIFKARYVIIATNAYSPKIDSYFYDKIIPTRAQVFVTEPLEKSVIDVCGYSDYGYMYYRMTFDNRFLIGGARNKHMALEHDTTEDRVNVLVQSELERYMQKYFPDVNKAISRRWAGIMGFSVDGLPLAGTLPNKPRVGFAVGFTGHGLALGAGVAKRAVDLLLHGEHAGAVDARRLNSQAIRDR
ncbi:MAG: FAD-binding oxidoreductase [Phototrophicaceae bacterium]